MDPTSSVPRKSTAAGISGLFLVVQLTRTRWSVTVPVDFTPGHLRELAGAISGMDGLGWDIALDALVEAAEEAVRTGLSPAHQVRQAA